MGIVVFVFVSVTLAWAAAFGGLNPSAARHSQMHYYWEESGRVLSRLHDYKPPARKSVVVDISGMAHSGADNTRMTKRDRSQLFPKLEIPPAIPEPSVAAPAAPAPLFQGQIEEMPLLPPNIPKPLGQPVRQPSLGRQVQMAILADRTFSKSASLTLNVTSLKNKVTLRGIVLDKEEKEAIGKKAAQIAGPKNVDNRLTVL